MAKKKQFKGESEVSIEDAIGCAIAGDPRGDQGTDLFEYSVDKIKVSWGGFAEKATYFVVLSREVGKTIFKNNLITHNMDDIETYVKTQIAFVARLQRNPADIADDTPLSAFRYNDTMVINLEQILDDYVKQKNPDASFEDDDLDESKTCGEVVQIVRDKIAGK